MAKAATIKGRAGLAAAIAVVLAAGGCSRAPAHAGADANGRPTPSGFPVPRYVSLKFGTVNARTAPDDDSRVLWTYHVKGLPLQVIAETADWRRICDSQGGVAWVKKTAINGERTVLRLADQPLILRKAAKADSEAAGALAAHALAELDKCKGGWCRIKVGKDRGWIPAAEVWGADDKVQCH